MQMTRIEIYLVSLQGSLRCVNLAPKTSDQDRYNMDHIMTVLFALDNVNELLCQPLKRERSIKVPVFDYSFGGMMISQYMPVMHVVMPNWRLNDLKMKIL